MQNEKCSDPNWCNLQCKWCESYSTCKDEVEERIKNNDSTNDD
jgi:MoaA/NifB/PqqE/SkfB family radical SAM enzyme